MQWLDTKFWMIPPSLSHQLLWDAGQLFSWGLYVALVCRTLPAPKHLYCWVLHSLFSCRHRSLYAELCPEYGFGSIRAVESALLISVTNRGLDSGLPSWKMNRGPGPLPLITMYPSRAETGHNGLLVLPTYTSTPWRKGSVLEVVGGIWTIWLLTCSGWPVRWVLGCCGWLPEPFRYPPDNLLEGGLAELDFIGKFRGWVIPCSHVFELWSGSTADTISWLEEIAKLTAGTRQNRLTWRHACSFPQQHWTSEEPMCYCACAIIAQPKLRDYPRPWYWMLII